MNVFGYLSYVGFMGFMVLFFGKITDFGFVWFQKEEFFPALTWLWMTLTTKFLLWLLYIKLIQGIYLSTYAYYKIPIEIPSRTIQSVSQLSLALLMGFHYFLTGWVIQYFHLHLFSMTTFVLAVSLLMGFTMQRWFRSLNQITVIFIRNETK